MKKVQKKHCFKKLIATLGLFLSGPVFASGPVELVVAYAAGGVSDLMARNLATYIEPSLKNKMIVQNRPGAAGMVGTNFVYKAKPDGKTVLLARIATLAVAPNLQRVPYDPTGFTPLGMIATDPIVCVTSSRKNYNSISEVKDALTSRAGTLTYSSSGVGSLNQFAVLRLLEVLGVENPQRAAAHVPSQGEGPALTAVAGGHIDLFCGNVGPILPQIQSGTVKGLLVTSRERILGLEKVPTARELGLEEMEEVVGWSALMGPPDMPKVEVDLYLSALEQVKNHEAWQQFIKKMGSEPNILPPEETQQFISQQQDIYREMAIRMGLKRN
ncbi:tripartite tricarboxylate transporter substrate binding protein [Paenalcaligenes niemegkensis]|uniref:Bug family tripartite tricarboxylate transporter substrate binding protein n=1 Tax=Paenalcaligenes niemegkensis TaxID=2895469 RepID=UPI001EE86831|nr:tripartite tricarboxylate transporter substrate binding protein [Paenalcaligenes niemegkensis]MCQ9617812.1 tripartite tricarboxylate transporter substrate binding protein [Paenalcaligenes niemegkensis]